MPGGLSDSAVDRTGDKAEVEDTPVGGAIG
jgi:hypothetical protein